MSELQEKLEEAHKDLVLKVQLALEPAIEYPKAVEKEFTFEPAAKQVPEEAGSTEAPKPHEWALLTQAKI